MFTDPIADMLTRIRNANIVSHPEVEMPSSKLKVELAKVLKEEGYITDYYEKEIGKFKVLVITLKYDETNKPVISNLKRISKTGLRVYSKAKDLPQVFGGGLDSGQGVRFARFSGFEENPGGTVPSFQEVSWRIV